MSKYMMMFYSAFGSIIHSNKMGLIVCVYIVLLKESNLITCLDLYFNYKSAHRLLMENIFWEDILHHCHSTTNSYVNLWNNLKIHKPKTKQNSWTLEIIKTWKLQRLIKYLFCKFLEWLDIYIVNQSSPSLILSQFKLIHEVCNSCFPQLHNCRCHVNNGFT
jgi:hypothetical protein